MNTSNYSVERGLRFAAGLFVLITIVLGIWLLYDLAKTNSAFSEDVLLSSREGEIEDELIIDPTHRGAA